MILGIQIMWKLEIWPLSRADTYGQEIFEMLKMTWNVLSIV